MNYDQKGDLVEQLIFEAYKDKYIRSSEAFKQLIKKDYGYEVKSDLYKKIVNYQIKKYGISLSNLGSREYDKYFSQRESNRRFWKRKKNAFRTKCIRRLEEIEEGRCKKIIKREKS